MASLLESLFKTKHPVIGMVHLAPLPGSPRWGGSMDRVLERALVDAKALRRGGAHAFVIENYGDLPFDGGSVEPACTAAMAVALRACREATGLPAGVNVLRNDTAAALGVAIAGGAVFIRTNVHTGSMVGDQGILQGKAATTMRERARLGADGIAVFADILVKHAVPLGERDPRRAAREAVERGLADGLLATGTATGARLDFRELAAIRDEVEAAPLLVASGTTPRDMALIASLADGVIAGTVLKVDGKTSNPVDPARVRALVRAAAKAWR